MSRYHGAITSQNGTAPKPVIDKIIQALSAITSQNGTAPKLSCMVVGHVGGAITSQNGTAPKRRATWLSVCPVRLPVRTALLQNLALPIPARKVVRLPVRTALLQNYWLPRDR